MGKWNFDVIFTGTTVEQKDNVAYFIDGIQRRGKEAGAEFTDAVLRGETRNGETAEGVKRRINELTDALRVFNDDPRLKSLAASVRELEAEKFAKDLVTAIRGS